MRDAVQRPNTPVTYILSDELTMYADQLGVSPAKVKLQEWPRGLSASVEGIVPKKGLFWSKGQHGMQAANTGLVPP